MKKHPDKARTPVLPTPFHDEHHHDHGDTFLHDPRRVSRLRWAFLLTSSMMVLEAIGGIVSGSLALLADAGHMLVDAAALAFAWIGAVVARRPADSRRSYGYARLEVLVGYTNAMLQIILVAWILVEAAQRLWQPTAILSATMFWIAMLGLSMNLLVLVVLRGHDHDDVNAAGAFLHVLGDLLGSIGAVTAAVIIHLFGWLWMDPVISAFVAVLILGNAWRLVKKSAHILLEGVPEGIDVDEVTSAIEESCQEITNVHHIHIWQLTGGSHLATLHAKLRAGYSADQAIQSVRKILHKSYSVDHVTIQIEDSPCRSSCATEENTTRELDDRQVPLLK